MLEAASSGAQFSPGYSSAQTARAAGLKGRDPSRGPRAETVLGMVAPARPQRQQAAGYGGRYTSNATGVGMVPPPTSAPPAVLRPVPRPLGRPAASGLGHVPPTARVASHQGAPGAGEHTSMDGGDGATGRGAQPTAPAAPQPASALQPPLDSAVIIRPVASTPPQGMPSYVLDSSGAAVVRYSQAPMDMVSLGERITLMEEGIRQAQERQTAWEAHKAEEAVQEKAAQVEQVAALEKRLEKAVQDKLDDRLGDITKMLRDLHSDRSRPAEGSGSASQQTDSGVAL